MTTKTFTSIAWWTGGAQKVNPDDMDKFLIQVHFNKQDMSPYGWIRIGEVSATIDIEDPNEIVKQQLEGIEREIESVKAAAAEKINYFETLKNNLLALPNESDRTFGQPHRGHPIDPDDDIPF